MQDSHEYLCIHLIPRQATSPQPHQVEIPPEPEQSATPTPQPNQMEMPPEPENMDIDIPEDIPDLINIPEEILYICKGTEYTGISVVVDI